MSKTTKRKMATEKVKGAKGSLKPCYPPPSALTHCQQKRAAIRRAKDKKSRAKDDKGNAKLGRDAASDGGGSSGLEAVGNRSNLLLPFPRQWDCPVNLHSFYLFRASPRYLSPALMEHFNNNQLHFPKEVNSPRSSGRIRAQSRGPFSPQPTLRFSPAPVAHRVRSK